MGEFTARGALQAGFDLIRQRPWLVLLWAVLFLALTFIESAAFQAFQAWRTSAVAAGRAPYRLLGQMMAYNTTVMVASMVVQAVLWTSAFRALLRPNDGAPVAYGREELVVTVSWVIVQLVVTLASAALTVFITDRVIRAGGSIPIAPVLRAPGAVLGAIGLYWAAVAGVWAFARGEIALLRCWTMMRGRFWTVTGLVAGLAVVVYVLRAAVRALAAVLTHHARLPALTLQTLTQTPLIFVTLAGALITVLQMVFLAGIVTSAYRTAGAKPQAVASFSSGAAASPS